MSSEETTAFRHVPPTGVIWVMTQAAAAGYEPGATTWANLGQGAPETGPLPDAPARIRQILIDGDEDDEYGPVGGTQALRQAVADLYNARYRRGKKPYTWEHVAISPGGRAGLTRIAASLDRVNVGHVIPDYTAYKELFGAFSTFVPIPMMGGHRGERFDAHRFRQAVLNFNLKAMLFSNPGNPTGKLLSGDCLAGWVQTARELGCMLILDEFYAHYIFGGPRLTVSAAEFVEDVDNDPVIIVDGVTKNWRLPGYRLSWTIGPKNVIKRLISAGSYLDGGAAHLLQKAVLPLLDPATADNEARAIQACFAPKREYFVRELRRLGLQIDTMPAGSFYCWAKVEGLPDGWNTGAGFFEKALAAGVITVPGRFFFINPGGPTEQHNPLGDWIRFSFGPKMMVLERGIAQLEHAMRG